MLTAAIIGAGDLGGACAQALAARDRLARLVIVDEAGTIAAGKALDIQQMGAVEGFHTRLEGTTDPAAAVGCDVWIVADAAPAPDRLAPLAGDAPIVFAGAATVDAIEAAVGDAAMPRRRIVGSAPEAFRSAVTGIVALEARCSPGEIRLSVLGAPGRFVVPWSEASIGGYSLEQVLSQVQLTRVEARAARLWPPGAYTLGIAAARVAEAILTGSRQTFSVLTMLEGEFSAKRRVGAVPALLAPPGIVQCRVPTLNSRERVLLETALG
jgi:malate dehydrogenase